MQLQKRVEMAINSKEYKQLKNEIEAYLSDAIKIEDVKLKDFKYAMEYSLLAGGKRLRAVMLIKTAEICGFPAKKAMPFAAALEMIHAYSLIHDDLPAMDDDDYRRGKLSNHKMFDEATAILAGDALLNYAYQMMIKETIKNDGSINYLVATSKIADAAGINGMIGGQVIDTKSNADNFDEESLQFIHAHKTADLIKASILAGALLAETTTENLDYFEQFAYHFGMAFQITDDILDRIGNEELLGKPIGSDDKANKITYLRLYGLEKAKKHAEREILAAENILTKIDLDTSFFNDLNQYLLKRQR